MYFMQNSRRNRYIPCNLRVFFFTFIQKPKAAVNGKAVAANMKAKAAGSKPVAAAKPAAGAGRASPTKPAASNPSSYLTKGTALCDFVAVFACVVKNVCRMCRLGKKMPGPAAADMPPPERPEVQEPTPVPAAKEGNR